MDISLQKKELRKKMFAKRADLPLNIKRTYDNWFCSELQKIIDVRKCKTIHLYLPMGSEIDITPLISYLLEKNITIIAPKTLPKRKLENRVLSSLENIEKGIFDTYHPSTTNEYKYSFDLIIVPGLAYDKDNYRLGYGGGYYDNFLNNHPNAYKLGIFYPFQLVNKVPIESHDLKLDQIITYHD